MYTDINMRVSEDQDISAVVSTIVSTDSIDLNPDDGIGQNQPPDIGAGMKVRAAFNITEAVVGTSSFVQFQIITDSTADLATTPLVLGQTEPIPEADLFLGALIFVEMNVDVNDAQGMVQRFLGAQYVISAATTTLGLVTANFVIDIADGKRFYRSGFVVA
jgi:hypothetical protein